MQSLRDALAEAGFAPLLERLVAQGVVTDLDAPLESDEPTVCIRCRGAGYMVRDVLPGHPDFGKLVECSCEIGQQRAERRQQRIWSDALVPPKMANYSLDTLGRRPGKAELAELLRGWRDTGKWLALLGPKGTCKTGAAVALLLEHVREHGPGTGRYVVLPTVLAKVRKTYDDRSADAPDELEVLQTLIDVQFLVLDDIGTATLTGWGQEKLFTVINERDLHHRVSDPRITVVTSNLPLVAPRDKPKAPTLPKHLDDEGRTWDRIGGWCGPKRPDGSYEWVLELGGASQRGLDL
jgi:DNA replication protein DnaC